MFKDFQVKRIRKDGSSACKSIKKETVAQVFSCGFANFKNTFLYGTPLVAVSDNAIFTTESLK